jgi:hypothetical protein
MKTLLNNPKHGVYDFEENGVVVAVIDKENIGTTIILCDEKEKYIQRFWVEDSDEELVMRCQHMRALGIESN